jgi:hypothetical protein
MVRIAFSRESCSELVSSQRKNEQGSQTMLSIAGYVHGNNHGKTTQRPTHSEGAGKALLISPVLVVMLMAIGCGGGGPTASVTPPSPVVNEGSPQAPVVLTLNTPLQGQVGASGTSYYAFDISQPGQYVISLTETQSDLGWELEVDPGLGLPGTFATCDTFDSIADEVCPVTLSLNGFSTIRYLIKVIEYDLNAGRFNISVSFIPTTPTLDCVTFQTSVNPIFDRNLSGTTCSASGCHAIGAASGGAFNLYPNALPNSPEMQANFLAAKAFSNLANPVQSRLLLEPLAGAQNTVGSHGGGDIFASTSDSNYQTIYGWIANQVPAPNQCYP